MREIDYTDEFKRCYSQLPWEVQRKASRQELLFRKNPLHPSLHTEKLKPTQKEYWSFRIDRNYRIIFRFLDSKITLVTCGHHNWIYRYILTH